MKERYRIHTCPAVSQANQITGETYRITILTKSLIRLEYSEDGVFEDRATQTVLYRDFPETTYRIIRTKDGIELHTSCLHLIYNEQKFSRYGLSIQVKGRISDYRSTWHYGEEIHDLGGTARTLDEVNGAIKLEHGIISRFGYSVLDDSRSHVILEDGWIEPRKKGIQDLYFFGYGHDYKKALEDFYHLCGRTPMLPRYALGNWWSRFYPYTEETYLELMDRFEQENLPFTVAVIDMDWHLVDIDEKYGSGWTGYTWNKSYFPEPARFLNHLHNRGMHVTLNVHPAEGVRAHEEMYKEFAEAMGVDDTKEDPVNCDLTDPKFIEYYFTFLHHPREKEGVDFWWIDWQQGTNSKIEGLDPLWILNHFHFLDNQKNGKRPMCFSRYAGPGSHRYPVGFSGDTITTWESLDFQPYFTANASNIGYGWWSHDIGGHMRGYKNDEMEARWVQFGIYSPIMRLHSSCSEFNGKEPWRFKKEAETVIGDALRERHRMIPYLYSMNYRNYQKALPLIEPMYYEHPEEKEAYQVSNQYYFGSELLIAPVTSPRIPCLNVSCTRVWLPEGLWYDHYTGMIYRGGRVIDLYRGLTSIPVLAKAGAILPFTEEISASQATKNPKSFTIYVYAGADGAFTLYEDDNETCAYQDGVCVKTVITYQEKEAEAILTINGAEGECAFIPEERKFSVELAGFLKEAAEQIQIRIDGKTLAKEEYMVEYNQQKQAVRVSLKETAVTKKIQIILPGSLRTDENLISERVFDFLNQAEIEFAKKDEIYRLVQNEKRIPVLLAQLNAENLDKDLYGVLLEILTA